MADQAGKTVTLDGHEIALSNLDKVLFPESGLTKGDLITYYRRIADRALPHFRGRPLTMQRFPDGIAASGFFQKAIPDHFPGWIDRVTMTKEDGRIDHVVANSGAFLVYLANQGCITPHLGLARTGKPDHPDRLVFDLDPSDDDFAKVRDAARRLKDLLDSLELVSFVQTTGSRGLHIVVPLDRSADFDRTREFAHGVASHLAERHDDSLTVAQRKDKRGNRVYLDTLRNAYGQTAVAPYAVRAREGAPVATPLRWDEVARSDLDPQGYSITTLFRRLAQIDDPWAGLTADPPSDAAAIDAAAERLAAIR